MDLAAMSNAERWLEISEVMTFEVQTVAAAAAEVTETIETEIAASEICERGEQEETLEAEPEMIDTHEPRSARVLSINELRQRLGIEARDVAPTRSAPMPATSRPRIVRRRESEAYEELAAG